MIILVHGKAGVRADFGTSLRFCPRFCFHFIGADIMRGGEKGSVRQVELVRDISCCAHSGRVRTAQATLPGAFKRTVTPGRRWNLTECWCGVLFVIPNV